MTTATEPTARQKEAARLIALARKDAAGPGLVRSAWDGLKAVVTVLVVGDLVILDAVVND